MKRPASDEIRSITIDKLQLKELTTRLDAIIRLQCVQLPEKMGQWDKIKLLNQSGLSSKDISGILGIKDSSVRSALSRIKDRESGDVRNDETSPSDSGQTTSAADTAQPSTEKLEEMSDVDGPVQSALPP